jgi:ribosomal-protein-serine acetyltransferase
MKPILMNFPMPITTNRLIMRPPEIGDGIKLNEAVLETYDKLKLMMPWAKQKPTIDDSEEFVRQAAANWILKNNDEPYLPLFIFDRKKEIFLGATGYHHMDWNIPTLEIGYWLRTSYQKKGIMTEAINAITYYAFIELKVKRLEIRCDITNDDSRKIAERLGYLLESKLKGNRLNVTTGQISDTLIYVRHNATALPELSIGWKESN